MKTVLVWVLYLYVNTNGASIGGPVVIDNIASREECRRTAAYLQYNSDYQHIKALCVQVTKVK